MVSAQILIVEDDNIVAKDLQNCLQSFGYIVPTVASSGAEAIQKVAETLPDLVLMDIKLKGEMDGIEASAQIQTRFDIPVIYLTAYANDNILQRARLTKPYGYILKPFTERELYTTIEIALHKHQMEKKLKEWATTTLEQIAEAVLITNRDGLIEYVNPAFEQITGYTRKEILGQTPRILKSGQHQPAFYERLWQTIYSGQAFSAVFINRKKNGELYYSEESITPLKDSQGYITHFVSTGRDITASRQAQQALRQSQTRLAEAQRIAQLGHWDWNIQTNELHWSDEVYRILGLIPQELTPTYEIFLKTVHPDDREFVQESIETALRRQKSYGIDHRIVKADGEIRIVQTQAEVTSDQAGQPIWMVGTIQDISERKQLEARLTAIYQLGQELTLLHDETSIIRPVLETATDLLQFEVAGYGLVDQTTGELEYRYHLVNGLMKPIDLRLPLDGDQSIGVRVARSGQAIYVPDVTRESGYIDIQEDRSNRSGLYVPMKVGERVIGVLNAESIKPNYFTPADQQLLQTLADQTAVALENARLYAETQRRTRELAALNKAGRMMASSLDLSSVLEQTLVEVKAILEAEGASTLLYNLINDELVFAAAASPKAEVILGTQVPLDTSIAGWVVRKGQSILVDDVQQDPRFYKRIDALTGLTTHSILAVPLIFKGKVIGVVEAINKARGHFKPDDLEMLEALSSSAAIAIENARLYEAERVRYRETEALRRAALTLISTIALDEIFTRILTELQHVVPYDSASVQLLKGDRLEIIGGVGFPDLSKVLGVTIAAKGNIPNALVVESREPVIIGDVKETHLAFDQTPHTAAKIRGWMGVPLIIGERVIGILTLDKYQPDFYTQNHGRMAMAYGAQAAIAIENARLHAETERRAQQLAVLHELDRAITASLCIDDVYQAFSHHTARLLCYDRMAISLREADGMRLAYITGEDESKSPSGTMLPINNSAMGQVVAEGQPMLRHNIAVDIRFPEDEQLATEGIQSMMIIPLRVKGQVIGTWNIGCHQTEAYNPDDLEIAQSMADQLAIAIENARLYQTEREQARRLQESQAQLIQVEKMAALGRLVASVAHEVNNPLQSIQACLTLIQDELENDQRSERSNHYIDIAEGEIERIATIIRRMRDFYRPLSQPQRQASNPDDFYRPAQEELQSVDLYAILDNVLLLANKQLQHSEVIVEQEWADNLPPIQGNPDHLKQVFLNLILNAIDAMTGQGGTLSIRVRLDQAAGDNDHPRPVVCIEFSDVGQGIPPEILPRLFEPLFTTKQKGSGLGLFTSRKIIEAHHGKITVESEVGIGTTFTILLPLEQPS